MASKSKVTLTFAGDSDKLEKTFDRVGSAADDMASDVRRSSEKMSRSSTESFDAVGESAGTLDQRAMGFRDTITGVEDTMAGWGQLMEGDVAGGMFTLGAGIGDLASGVENLIVPIVQSGATWVTTHASMAASSIASAASAVASWISMAAASVANAAVVAASWLLAFAPVIIVVAIVAGLVVLIIKNWDTIKEVIQAGWEFVKQITSAAWNWIKDTISSIISTAVDLVTGHIEMVKSIVSGAWDFIKDVTSTAWNFVKDTIVDIFTATSDFVSDKIDGVVGFFTDLPGRITSALSGLAEAFKAPFRNAFQGIKDLWNSTLAGKGVKIPGFAGFGGIDFKIPPLAQGGIVKSSPGGSIVNVGEGGRDEAVVPLPRGMRNGIGGGGRTVIELRSSGAPVDDFLLEILRKAIANDGGGVVAVLG